MRWYNALQIKVYINHTEFRAGSDESFPQTTITLELPSLLWWITTDDDVVVRTSQPRVLRRYHVRTAHRWNNVTSCIVAKRCVLEQKLISTVYRKSYMRNWLCQDEWPWPLFRGRLMSREPLRHIRHWISQKPLQIEALFPRITIWKWPMGNPMVTRQMTSGDPERSSRDPNTLRIQYRENSWRCYLAKIAYY